MGALHAALLVGDVSFRVRVRARMRVPPVPAHPRRRIRRRGPSRPQYDLTVQEIAIVDKLRDEKRARTKRILAVGVIQKWWQLHASKKRSARDTGAEKTLLQQARHTAKLATKGPHRYEAALLRKVVKARSHRREDQARGTHTDAIVASMQEQMDIERELSLEWRAEMTARSARLSTMVATLLETMSPDNAVLQQVKEAEQEGRELRRARRSNTATRTPRSGKRMPSRAASRILFRGDLLQQPASEAKKVSPTESSGSSASHDVVLHEEAGDDAPYPVFSPPPPSQLLDGSGARAFAKPALTFSTTAHEKISL
jgi:hypothetical protein